MIAENYMRIVSRYSAAHFLALRASSHGAAGRFDRARRAMTASWRLMESARQAVFDEVAPDQYLRLNILTAAKIKKEKAA